MRLRLRFAQVLMLTAWLLATGVHWDFVQVLAWGRMFANNARVLPLRDAWELTFAVSGMCEACLVVQDAKQDDSGDTLTVLANAAKEPLVFQSPLEIVVCSPAAQPWMMQETPTPIHERAQPPTPPPRSVV